MVHDEWELQARRYKAQLERAQALLEDERKATEYWRGRALKFERGPRGDEQGAQSKLSRIRLLVESLYCLSSFKEYVASIERIAQILDEFEG